MHRIEVWADFSNLILSRTQVPTVVSYGHPFGGLLQVDLSSSCKSFWTSWSSPGGFWEVSPEASWAFVLVRYQHGRARGTKSRLRKLCPLAPPSRARAPLLLWERGSSGSGGGLCAMLEKPRFVPMVRPYASGAPMCLLICSSRPRGLCATPPPTKAR